MFSKQQVKQIITEAINSLDNDEFEKDIINSLFESELIENDLATATGIVVGLGTVLAPLAMWSYSKISPIVKQASNDILSVFNNNNKKIIVNNSVDNPNELKEFFDLLSNDKVFSSKLLNLGKLSNQIKSLSPGDMSKNASDIKNKFRDSVIDLNSYVKNLYKDFYSTENSEDIRKIRKKFSIPVPR